MSSKLDDFRRGSTQVIYRERANGRWEYWTYEDARDDPAAQAGLAMDQIAKLERLNAELLTALQALTGQARNFGAYDLFVPRSVVDRALAVIAKARGKE